jgi:hypothetical protein
VLWKARFFASSILCPRYDPVTGCVHDLVFEIENLKKWGIPVGLSFPNQEEDFISLEGK